MSLIEDMRGGKQNDPNFRTRMIGQGVFADLIKNRFNKTCQKLGINIGENIKLDTSRFKQPVLSANNSILSS